MEIKLSEELEKQIKEAFVAFKKEKVEEALTKAAELLIKRLKEASPYNPDGVSPHFRDSWVQKKQYTGVRYVGNTKAVIYKGREVPLSNILENSIKSRHKGFIRKTYRKHASEIEAEFIKNLK